MCAAFETKNKILVIRLSSLGDVLLTTPLLRVLKRKYNGSEIHFIVKQQYADAVRFNSNISKVFIYDSSQIQNLISVLKLNEYNYVLDLQNNFRSRKIIRSLAVQTYRYSKPSFKKFLLVKFKINLLKDLKPIPERYAESIDDLELDSKGLELALPEKVIPRLSEKENYIGFCPSARHFTKRWPLEYFIELGNMLSGHGYKVVLFGGSSDKDICEVISKGIKDSVNLQNDNNLFQTAADMKKCKLIISNDSGLMHTAAAVGTPLISIFGSSVKEFGFSPYGVKNLILENNSLSCRPCSHIGKDKCPKQHFKCMKDITPQLVIDQLQNFLKIL